MCFVFVQFFLPRVVVNQVWVFVYATQACQHFDCIQRELFTKSVYYAQHRRADCVASVDCCVYSRLESEVK